MKTALNILSLGLGLLTGASAFASGGQCASSQPFKCPQSMQKMCDAGLKLWNDQKNGWRVSNGSGDESFYYDKSKGGWCRRRADDKKDQYSGQDDSSSSTDDNTVCGEKLKKELKEADDYGGSGSIGNTSGQQTQAQQKSEYRYQIDDKGALLVSAPTDDHKFDKVNHMRIAHLDTDSDTKHINKQNKSELMITATDSGCSGGEARKYVQREMDASASATCDAGAKRNQPVDLSACSGDLNGNSNGTIGSSVSGQIR